jgi:hypothetical protein
MYRVVGQDLKVKVNGTIKTFHIGSIVNLPEKSAHMFIQQGKIKPVAEEPQIPITQQYEPTESDRELEKIIGKPDMNPNRYLCVKYGKLAGRYCLGHVKDRLWWAWWCLECRPYTEPERN